MRFCLCRGNNPLIRAVLGEGLASMDDFVSTANTIFMKVAIIKVGSNLSWPMLISVQD